MSQASSDSSARRAEASASAQPAPETRLIRVAHSPDADDAFMFYALATGKVATPGLKFTHVLADIETLNQAAREELYDVTALSFYAYGFLHHQYLLLDCGASFGEGYGPALVASHLLKRDDLARRRIAVPGLWTTGYLVLKLWAPEIEAVPMAFDKILDAVREETVDAGLLIHEGQLLFPQYGLHRIVDLGQWWLAETGLPLPLGGNAIRRALGVELGRQVARALRQSVAFGLEHREAALSYAMQFARDLDEHLADRFVGMYVNRWTLGYGERGRQAVRELLRRAHQAALLPEAVEPEFLTEEEP
ncbi:MAG: ABC transporter substrate-binding protein [Acidobacteriia bacterium]|jgi:1,4-dihydroxy-6-naphthoate synthase|nr:ABC transporter substrate-binding protein [Terriglobia bacterium]